jgi:hypothetical protein
MPEMLPAMRELRTTFWSRVVAGRRVVGREVGVVADGSAIVLASVLVDEDPRPGVELMRCVVPFVQYSGEESSESDQQLYESDLLCEASLRV